MPINKDIPTSGLKRARSLDSHKQACDMALLYSDEEEADRLEAYLSLRPHYLLKGETLGLY